jgi:multidrug efflux system membrane fusion protein
MRKIYAIFPAAIVVAAAAIYLARGTAPKVVPPQPQPVDAAVVALKDVPLYVSGLGTVIPLQTVTVRTQIDGQIVAIRFREGQRVRANDVLAQIDPRYLRAKLKETAGQLTRDHVILANAERDLSRYRQAFNTGTVTQQTIDTQAATVAQAKAAIAVDEGAIEEVKVQLDYCTIRSPATGIAGLRQVDEGNLIRTTDPTGIVTIVTVSPISVVFTVAERDVGRVRKALRGETRKVPVTLLDSDNQNVLASGAMEAIDNVVDAASGTVKLRAVFKNSKENLFPGEFVNAQVRVGTLKQVPVVPSQALMGNAGNNYVYVAEHRATVKLVHVKTGRESHGEVPIVSGNINAGDLVITDGAGRVSNQATVQIQHVIPASRGSGGDSSTSDAAGSSPAAAGPNAGRSEHRAAEPLSGASDADSDDASGTPAP